MRTFNQQFLRLVPSGRKFVIGIPFIWLFLFFMLPFFLVMKISFSEAALSIPPYTEIY
ncbi:putrescine ABC transporter permease PotH, partial [Pseudomonas sp. FW215-R2]